MYYTKPVAKNHKKNEPGHVTRNFREILIFSDLQDECLAVHSVPLYVTVYEPHAL